MLPCEKFGSLKHCLNVEHICLVRTQPPNSLTHHCSAMSSKRSCGGLFSIPLGLKHIVNPMTHTYLDKKGLVGQLMDKYKGLWVRRAVRGLMGKPCHSLCPHPICCPALLSPVWKTRDSLSPSPAPEFLSLFLSPFRHAALITKRPIKTADAEN